MTEISINKLTSMEFSELKNIIKDLKSKQKENYEIEKAKEEGFKKGYEDGYKNFAEQINKIFQSLKKFDEELENIKKEYNSKILDMAFVIAEKILKYELEKEGYLKLIEAHIDFFGNKKIKVILPLKLKETIIQALKDKDEKMFERIEFSEDIEEGLYIKTGNLIREIEPLKQLEILKEQFSKWAYILR